MYAQVLYIMASYYILFFILGKSKEAEVKRINKELANIRSKFKGMLCVLELVKYIWYAISLLGACAI